LLVVAPDILLVQECVRDEVVDQLAEVAHAVGLEYQAWTGVRGSEGIGILSNTPLGRVASLPLTPGDDGARSALIARDIVVCPIACTHLAVTPSRLRTVQLREVLASVHEQHTAVVGGDLNADRSEVYPVARDLAWDAVAPPSGSPTGPVDEKWFRRGWESRFGETPKFPTVGRGVDWLLSRNLVVVANGIQHPGHNADGRPGTDHYVVWATFARPV
jgi:hypothetical protein